MHNDLKLFHLPYRCSGSNLELFIRLLEFSSELLFSVISRLGSTSGCWLLRDLTALEDRLSISDVSFLSGVFGNMLIFLGVLLARLGVSSTKVTK